MDFYIGQWTSPEGIWAFTVKDAQGSVVARASCGQAGTTGVFLTFGEEDGRYGAAIPAGAVDLVVAALKMAAAIAPKKA